MTIQTATALCQNDWTVATDATGHPTVVSGEDVTVWSTGSSRGSAYATLGAPDATIPDGATPSISDIKVYAQGDGSSVVPLVIFNNTSDPDSTIAAWTSVGAEPPGTDLQGNTDPHLLDYTPEQEGLPFLDSATAAALATAAAAGTVVVYVRGNSFPGAVTYLGSQPIAVVWEWDDGETAPTTIPQLRLTNRNSGLVNAGFYRQGGNRLTGPL